MAKLTKTQGANGASPVSQPKKLVKRPRAGMRLLYDCTKCPAFCCSIYGRVAVKASDVRRLADYFELTLDQAKARFTKLNGRERILRRKTDPLLGETCKFLDTQTRGCTIYEARPAICREYPGEKRCGYYDVVQFERRTQNDKYVLPIIQITFPGPPAFPPPPTVKPRRA